MQGGPLMHVIAAKAVAFGEALQPSFKLYARNVVENAKALAETLKSDGLDIVSGGTDTHLMLVDLRPKRLTGKVAEAALGRAHITCNKNGIPFDPEKPMVTSGVRLGTPACTTRGFGIAEFRQVGDLIAEVLDVLSQQHRRGRRARGGGGAREGEAVDRAVPDLPGLSRAGGGMRCPSCASLDTQVKDSRPTEDSAVIRRRRVCLACNFRFTTFERVQLRELVVIKRNGRRVPFDRDKLMRSVQIALRKRPVEPERIEQAVSKIVRELESLGESEITSETIGEMVMEQLRALDDVAYVRFASVYRNFREAKDFEAVLDELSGEEEPRRAQMSIAAVSVADDAQDEHFMALALALGRRGLGQTWPNPAVGAVIVPRRRPVRSSSAAAGRRPADGRMRRREALGRAGAAARGATLYVTLEPCSHHGKTPPCADAIMAAGIARVVSALEDPNPKVAGQGHARLRAGGIAVEVGARRRRGAHARMRATSGACAMAGRMCCSSLRSVADDKVGLAGRRPVAITGEAARDRVHLMRAESDAVLIGIGTALADDPLLTCRLPGMGARSPVRVVLDSRLRLPPDGRLARSARDIPVWVIASASAPAAAERRLARAGRGGVCGWRQRAPRSTRLPRSKCSPPAGSPG